MSDENEKLNEANAEAVVDAAPKKYELELAPNVVQKWKITLAQKRGTYQAGIGKFSTGECLVWAFLPIRGLAAKPR